MVKRRRTTKRKPARRTIKKKSKAKKGVRKAPFGGYTINFGNSRHNLQDVFGKRPITPSEMTKKLWAYVKRYKLAG